MHLPDRGFHSQCASRRSGLAMRGGFHAAEHHVEFGAVEVLAVHDDTGDLLRVAMSSRGLAESSTRSASFPFSTAPSWSSIPKKRAD